MDYNIFKKKVKKIRHHPTDILRIVAWRGARLADEERGAAKRRGRGLGRRKIKNLHNNKKEFDCFFSFVIMTLV